MNNEIINNLSGAIISPLFDEVCEKSSVTEAKNICKSIEFLYKHELIQEAFSLLNILIMTTGIEVPIEYFSIVDEFKLREAFVEEAITDLEDILFDFE